MSVKITKDNLMQILTDLGKEYKTQVLGVGRQRKNQL
jgi:hypothetical protein